MTKFIMKEANGKQKEVDLKVKLFSDGAIKKDMEEVNPIVHGFTTNPSLMKKAEVKDFEAHAKDLLRTFAPKPLSVEVFSDDIDEMEKQAREIATWGPNVNVKIPITNTKGTSTAPLIQKLSQAGLQLNVTAILTIGQVKTVARVLSPETPSIVSVFAGRIADTLRDPIPIMKQAARILKPNQKAELLWASTREVANILQADQSGCHIITVTPDILKKLKLAGKDLTEYSLETVKMFYDDGVKNGFKINYNKQPEVKIEATVPEAAAAK